MPPAAFRIITRTRLHSWVLSATAAQRLAVVPSTKYALKIPIPELIFALLRLQAASACTLTN
eukprot:scaffold143433_cov29-Prasinocladus_malaysianus.AAC.1